MPWLLTSLIATLTSTVLLLTVYLALWFRYRRPYLAWWSAGWAVYSARLGVIIAQRQGVEHPFLPLLHYLLVLASTWLLLRGVHVFLGRRPPAAWDWLGALTATYLVLGWGLDVASLWICIPVYMVTALMLAGSGAAILRDRRAGPRLAGTASGLAGWALILWGLHRADYPFVKDMPWLAPFGFLLASALTTLLALALLAMFFEELSQEIKQAKDDLQENRQTLGSILAATPVGVGLMKDRRVIWANDTAYRLTGYPPGSWIDQDLTSLYATPEEYARVGGVVYGQLAAFGYGSDQTVMRKKDGTLLHCQMQVMPLSAEDHAKGFIFAFTDLSARMAVEDELRRTSRTLRAIEQCQRAMLHAQDEARLMGEVCRIVCEAGGYCLAWVGLLGGGQAGGVTPAAQWGYEDGYLESAAVSASGDDPRGRGPLGAALRSGRPQVVQDVHADPAFAPWREEALRRGYASVLGLPLSQEGRTFGVLGIYAREAGAFTQQEVGFLEGLAQDLGFGLASLRLREARRLAQVLIDTTPDAILLLGPDGVVVSINRAAARRLGKDVDELLGTSILDNLPPEVGARRRQAGLDVLATGRPLEFEEEAQGRVYEYRLHPVPDRDGRYNYIAAYSRDITERKQRQRELESSINNYRTLTRHSLQGIAILEINPTRFAYVNPRMTEIFGYSAEEFGALGPDEMWKLVHPEDRPLVRSRAENRLTGQTPPPRYEFRIVRKDGQTRWVEVFSAPTEHRGKPASQLAYIDITERKQAEDALRRAEAKYRMLVETTNDGIMVAQDDRPVFFNRRMLEITGFSAEEYVSQPFIEHVHPDDRALVTERYQRRLAGETVPTSYDFRMMSKQGRVRWIFVNSSQIEWEGRPATLNTLTDFTRRRQAEDALRQSQESYRRIVETAQEGVWAADRDGFTTYVNQRVAQMTGYAPEELIGQNISTLMASEEMPAHELQMALRRSLESRTYERRFIRKDGSVFWALISAVPQISPQGEYAGSFAMLTDITERKKVEDALRESEKRYRLISENTRDIVCLHDRQMRTIYASPSVKQVLGYDAEEYMARPVFEFIHPDDVLAVARQTQEKLARGQGDTYMQNRVRKKDGTYVWLETLTTPVPDGQGGIAGFLACSRDISERKQGERAVRESEQRFRLLAENSSDLVCLHDLKLGINYASPSSWRMLGYKPEEIQGTNIKQFLHPDDAAQVLDLIARGARGETDIPLRHENRLRKKDGGYLWVESLGSPVLGDDGSLQYLLVVSRDITERKDNETTLLQMAAGVAHNFNNVLMAIMSNAQAAQALLGRGHRRGGELKPLLDNVVQGARSGRDVVQRLSRYVGGSRGQLDSQEIVDLGRLLRSLRRLVAGMGQPDQGPPVEIALNLGRGLNVRGAGGELTEVFLNLAKNAREAMPQGGRLTVSGRVDNGQVLVTFADQGPGVDEATLGRFFEPFFTTKGVAGQGLGLTVSRAIVQAHGGQMEARSLPGQGTTLTVRLPLAQVMVPPAPSPAASRPPAPWPLRVLLVEDEALVAMGIATTLRKAGHQVLHSSTLAQAVEDLPGFQPDLILCDLGLPDGAGWEVCARLHREAALAGLENIPLVVLSGWSSDQIQRQGDQSCQAAAYLQKPVESARLLQVLALAAPGRPREPQALN